MRRGRPGLLGTMARTAVVAGTATAVSGNVARRQAGGAPASQLEAQAQQQAMMAAAPAAPVAPAAPAPVSMEDKIAKIKGLGELKDAGLLTDAEFEVTKGSRSRQLASTHRTVDARGRRSSLLP